MNRFWGIVLAGAWVFGGCKVETISTGGADFSEALSFHASFDEGLNADFARGDGTLYTVTATRPEKKVVAGLETGGATVVAKGEGRLGDCLRFTDRKAPRIFFKAQENLPYAAKDWSGTVSFWLRVSPDEDLDPGYTDPVQITPRSALDGCFFFEFGIEDPRPCRLGVFADKEVWNPEGKPNKDIALEDRPLVTVQDHPFSRERWTHVVFTFEGFNNGNEEGVAVLYLDGAPRGELKGWEQTMTWDVSAAEIRLGVNFQGMLDEVSCFDRALSAEEVAALHAAME